MSLPTHIGGPPYFTWAWRLVIKDGPLQIIFCKNDTLNYVADFYLLAEIGKYINRLCCLNPNIAVVSDFRDIDVLNSRDKMLCGIKDGLDFRDQSGRQLRVRTIR